MKDALGLNLSYGAEVNSRDAFVPPKPKEFDNTALIGIFFEEVKGMKPSSNMGSGLVRLRVKGATLCNGKQRSVMTTNSIRIEAEN